MFQSICAVCIIKHTAIIYYICYCGESDRNCSSVLLSGGKVRVISPGLINDPWIIPLCPKTSDNGKREENEGGAAWNHTQGHWPSCSEAR